MKCMVLVATLLIATANAGGLRNARQLISERMSSAPSGGDCFALDEYDNKISISCCRDEAAPFHRKSEHKCTKLNKAASKYCPTGYDLERHTEDHNHGDVCRRHDGKDWFAPRRCTQVAKGQKQPWTVQGDCSYSSDEPCRVPPTPQCACSSPDFISIGENYCRTEYNTKGDSEGYYTIHSNTDLAKCQELCIALGDDCVGVEHTLKTNECELWNTLPHQAKHGYSSSGAECFILDRPYTEPPTYCEKVECPYGYHLEDAVNGCGGKCVKDCEKVECPYGYHLEDAVNGCGGKCVKDCEKVKECPKGYAPYTDKLGCGQCQKEITKCHKAKTKNQCLGKYNPFKPLAYNCQWCKSSNECKDIGSSCGYDEPEPCEPVKCEYGYHPEGADHEGCGGYCVKDCEETYDFERVGSNYCRTEYDTTGKDEGYYTLEEHVGSLDKCKQLCADDGHCRGIEYQANTKRCELWNITPPKAKYGTSYGIECYRMEKTSTCE